MSSRRSLGSWWAILVSCLLATTVRAHTVIVYPGWRGNNLHSNGTVEETDGLSVKIAKNATHYTDVLYPFGMQWLYPCGGMPTSTNRTKWPIKGGAISFQPGWFPGHKTAFIYVNLGLGTVPLNLSLTMVHPFELVGPTFEPYPGTFCLPQIPLPPNVDIKVGDNATIQVIELAMHGAALYNCVDITFAEIGDPEIPRVTRENCFNSTNITAKLLYSMNVDNSISSDASSHAQTIYSSLAIIPLLLVGYLARLI
ncbi:hypothetical protein LOZ12_005650 [Ophidiomyces ophidiicola]|uniref:uncharacterized protein n=1 Tax=Ophidiomyces ophidiicola TaxID=1387563 RepID=UPI0020C427A2|nr:uncharacterized protein LOZ57_000617 [Ophidiomyces ophidiicola]KAI1908690.1 hypothetical protein LOZ61_005431 [Ophidiomyces ophidiicola]KAI1915233.1 hypothetical protein LOZ64_003585 [Ophidiomyces ophidiicola]KAI1928880.1 hypothetical protein LOZ60_001989 [Ophidiomyces ophidiicola]KAI1952539.1 hypothetical protein LOZ57_000617 [Ophidiomyces ophidiicola]KAI1953431.1 hypothetical protein LOZ59_005081 [Ophidiomyces ophidiicola]